VVVTIEVRQLVFYAFAGNIAINNCFNAWSVHAALARWARRLRAVNFGERERIQTQSVPDFARLWRPVLECPPQEPNAFRAFACAAEDGYMLLQIPLSRTQACLDQET
jgi:hypothetical protein